MPLRTLLSCTTLLVVLLGLPAAAGEAERLYHEAWFQETAEGDFQRALGLYQAVYRNHPQSRMAGQASLRAGICLKELARREAAIEAFERTAAQYPDTRWAVAAERHLAELSGRVGLLIATEPPGAEILIHGTSRGIAPLRLEDLPDGVVRITARMAGYEPNRLEITYTAGAYQYVKLPLTPMLSTGVVHVEGPTPARPEVTAIRLVLLLDETLGAPPLPLDRWFWEATIPAERGEIVVRLPMGDETFAVEDQLGEQLAAWSEEHNGGEPLPILIQAPAMLRYKQVARILDACIRSGHTKLSLAATATTDEAPLSFRLQARSPDQHPGLEEVNATLAALDQRLEAIGMPRVAVPAELQEAYQLAKERWVNMEERAKAGLVRTEDVSQARSDYQRLHRQVRFAGRFRTLEDGVRYALKAPVSGQTRRLAEDALVAEGRVELLAVDSPTLLPQRAFLNPVEYAEVWESPEGSFGIKILLRPDTAQKLRPLEQVVIMVDGMSYGSLQLVGRTGEEGGSRQMLLKANLSGPEARLLAQYLREPVPPPLKVVGAWHER